jgi:hypothetical protein
MVAKSFEAIYGSMSIKTQQSYIVTQKNKIMTIFDDICLYGAPETKLYFLLALYS